MYKSQSYRQSLSIKTTIYTCTEKALIIYQKLFPDTYQINYNVGEIFFNISNIHTITNNLNLAQQYAKKALDIFHQTTFPQNPS